MKSNPNPNPECSICQGEGVLFEHSTVETCFCVKAEKTRDETEVEQLRALAKNLISLVIAYDNGYPQNRMPFKLSDLIDKAEELRVLD